MGVVAVDSSGSFEQLPIRVVAIKKVEKQKHNAYYISDEDIKHYKKIIHAKTLQKKPKKKKRRKKMKQENYREKVSAAFLFVAIQKLIKHTDIIQIDRDFEGWRMEIVRNYLKRLFGKVYCGTSLSNPSIEFIADHCKRGDNVKEAHAKTQAAKHGQLKPINPCPNLEQLLDFLE